MLITADRRPVLLLNGDCLVQYAISNFTSSYPNPNCISHEKVINHFVISPVFI